MKNNNRTTMKNKNEKTTIVQQSYNNRSTMKKTMKHKNENTTIVQQSYNLHTAKKTMKNVNETLINNHTTIVQQ